MFRPAIFMAVILFAHPAFGEIACSTSSCFDVDDSQPVAQPVEDELRKIADEYITILSSADFEGSGKYWELNSDGKTKDRTSLQKLRDKAGFVSEHEVTKFRRVFSVPEANGRTGYFVVTEYGTQTASFDVIQLIVWEVDGGRWRIICHGYVYRCPPGSTAIDLSSNNPLH